MDSKKLSTLQRQMDCNCFYFADGYILFNKECSRFFNDILIFNVIWIKLTHSSFFSAS